MRERKSEINKTFLIKEDEKWVISLVRKANYMHEQHAFLVLEGIENGVPTIYFMDFVGENWFLSLPNSELGKVRFEKYSQIFNHDDLKNIESKKNGDTKGDSKAIESKPKVESLVSAQKELIFRCKRRMMDLKPGDKIASKQWYIDVDKAIELIKLIDNQDLKDKKRYPFSFFGQQNPLTGSSAASSKRPKGHNCFTWAKEKLETVGLPVLKGDNVVDWLNQYACITGLTTYNPQTSNSSLWTYKNLSKAGIAVGVVLGIGYKLLS